VCLYVKVCQPHDLGVRLQPLVGDRALELLVAVDVGLVVVVGVDLCDLALSE